MLPEGTGRVNEAGLDFYERLVDTLLANGIEPLCTLYHWDMPAALDDRGGWLNRDIADWFADYARILFERLDGRVKKWVTLNEPWVVTDGGYLHGALAPGHTQHVRGADRQPQPDARARRRGEGLSRGRRARDRAGRQHRAQISRPATAPRTWPRPRAPMPT